MARRYVGNLCVYINYSDRDDESYHGSIVVDGQRWAFDGLKAPPAGLGDGVSYDSSEAYDKMADAALSFGSYYTTWNRGDDTPDWAPAAEVADAIDREACCYMVDCGEYEMRRKK